MKDVGRQRVTNFVAIKWRDTESEGSRQRSLYQREKMRNKQLTNSPLKKATKVRETDDSEDEDSDSRDEEESSNESEDDETTVSTVSMDLTSIDEDINDGSQDETLNLSELYDKENEMVPNPSTSTANENLIKVRICLC